jgi:hypothetical protein
MYHLGQTSEKWYVLAWLAVVLCVALFYVLAK